MKQLLTLIILAITFSSTCPGDSINEHSLTLDKIRAERLANLKSIVTQIERMIASGVGGTSKLIEAKLDLHEFERESESLVLKKIAPQEKIVLLEERRHSQLATDFKSGSGTTLEFLRSRERVLAAKQLLLEFRIQASLIPKKQKER